MSTHWKPGGSLYGSARISSGVLIASIGPSCPSPSGCETIASKQTVLRDGLCVPELVLLRLSKCLHKYNYSEQTT